MTDDLVTKAKEAVSKHDWKLGEELWTKLVQSRPLEPDMRTGLAFVYELTGKLRESLALIESALILGQEIKFPRMAGIMLPKARVLNKLNRTPEALQVLVQALSRMPKYRAALTLQVQIARETGNNPLLIQALGKLANEENRSNKWLEYSIVLEKSGLIHESVLAIENALKLDRKNIEYNRRLDRLLDIRDKSRSRSRSRSPRKSQRSPSRGRSRSYSRSPPKIEAKHENYLQSLVKKARQLEEAKKYRECIESHTQLIALVPTCPRSYLSKAYCFEMLKQLDLAKENLEMGFNLIEREPHEGKRNSLTKRVSLAKCRIAWKEGKYELSNQLFTTHLNTWPDHTPALKVYRELKENMSRKKSDEKSPTLDNKASVGSAAGLTEPKVKQSIPLTITPAQPIKIPLKGQSALFIADFIASIASEYRQYKIAILNHKLDGDSVKSVLGLETDFCTKMGLVGIKENLRQRVIYSRFMKAFL